MPGPTGHRQASLFAPTYALARRLFAAQRDPLLEKVHVSVDTFDAAILDDIGYVEQAREEYGGSESEEQSAPDAASQDQCADNG